MKVAFITDGATSFYHKSYPHVRDEIAWIRRLVQEGNEIVQVSPTCSKTVMGRFNGDTRDLLQEQFQERVGMRPLLDGEDYEPDLLFVSVFPWVSGFNYGGIDEIKKYAKKVKSIIWRVADYEESMGKSLLYDIVPAQHPEIYEKIKLVITTDHEFGWCRPELKDKYPNHMWMPLLYDPYYEITPKPLEERTLLSKFVGPIGSRVGVKGCLSKLEELGSKYNLKSEFWGESYSVKVRNPSFHLLDEKDKYKFVTPVADRIFTDFDSYKKFLSDSIITVHDGGPYLSKYDTPMAHWYTSKVLDAAYAGMVMLTKRWYGGENFGAYPELDDVSLENTVNQIMTSGDRILQRLITKQRFNINSESGIDKWYPILWSKFNEFV